MTENTQPQYKIQHLVDYLVLHKHIAGKLPTAVRVSNEFYDWYVREIKDTAKRLGLNAKEPKEVTFDGIKLVK